MVVSRSGRPGRGCHRRWQWGGRSRYRCAWRRQRPNLSLTAAGDRAYRCDLRRRRYAQRLSRDQDSGRVDTVPAREVFRIDAECRLQRSEAYRLAAQCRCHPWLMRTTVEAAVGAVAVGLRPERSTTGAGRWLEHAATASNGSSAHHLTINLLSIQTLMRRRLATARSVPAPCGSLARLRRHP